MPLPYELAESASSETNAQIGHWVVTQNAPPACDEDIAAVAADANGQQHPPSAAAADGGAAAPASALAPAQRARIDLNWAVRDAKNALGPASSRTNGPSRDLP